MEGVVWTPHRDGGHTREPEPGAAGLEGRRGPPRHGAQVVSTQVSCPQGVCRLGPVDSTRSLEALRLASRAWSWSRCSSWSLWVGFRGPKNLRGVWSGNRSELRGEKKGKAFQATSHAACGGACWRVGWGRGRGSGRCRGG